MSKLGRVGPKVVLEDLAKRAGVHRSTVSLALRDHPRISKEVRLRIQALAKKMGYRTNPLVAALMQSRRSGRKERDVVLAYVTSYPTRYGWRPPFHDRPNYFPGASARALELGYKLEHFWLAEPGMSAERMSDILTARGINGVLIGRLPPGQQEIQLLWNRFSCVALGLTLRNPNIHRIAEDYFSGAVKTMEQIAQRGYRRVGFVFSEADDSPRVGDQWLGACLRHQLRMSMDDITVPFYFHPGLEQAPIFASWFERTRPDVIVATHAQPVSDWLEQMGLKAPDDVGLATLINDHPEKGWSGIHSDPDKLGALATEMVVGLMHRSETGLPEDPHEVLLCGEWVEGSSLGRK